MKIFNSNIYYHTWTNRRYQDKYPYFDDVPYLALYQRDGNIRKQIVKNVDLYLFLKEHPGNYDAYPRITDRRNDKYTIKYNPKYDSFEIYCTRFAPCVGSINATTGEWICWNPKIFRNKPLWIWNKLLYEDKRGKVSRYINTINIILHTLIECLEKQKSTISEEQPCCKGEKQC